MSLSGVVDSSSAAVNLTSEGTGDWVHWGDASLERKAGVTAVIPNYVVVGDAGPTFNYNDDPRPISWSDGTPDTSSSGNINGVYKPNVNTGFSLTLPADTTPRLLKLHLGGFESSATFTAHLSDGSSADYVDNTSPVAGQYNRNYTITYSAASAGQTLTITWVMASDLGGGTVTLNAVSLANLVIPVTGIPSAEWFGAAAAVNGPAIFPVSITTAEVFGTVSIGTLTGVLTPAGVASGAALGTVTLRTSATLSPSGVASAEALGTVTLHTSTVTLLPAGVASGAALGTATLAALVSVSPTGVPSAEALGAVTFSTTVTLSPTGIASGEALGTVTLQTISLLNPTGVASAEALGSVTLVGGSTSIAVSGIPSSEAAGDVAILIGSLSPGGIASEEALGTVTLTFPTFLSVAGIPSAEAVGAPVVTPALTLLKPVGVPSAEAMGTPALALQIFLAPSGIASEEGLGAPTITQPLTLAVVGIASGEAFGVIAFSASAVLQPSGIATAEAFGFAVLTGIGKPINPLPPMGDSFATQWEDIYQQCCDALLETVPLSGATLTEENFFKIAGEVLADFCSRTGMVKKIFCTRLVAGTAQYDEGDQCVEVQSVMAGQTYLDRESGFMLDNTDAEWRSQYAQPESYREDQIPANTIELSPAPNLTGNRVAMATGGYGVLSTVTAGEFSETTSTMTPYAVGTPFAFGGNPYVETTNPGYGVRATKVPSTGNLQMFATALPYNITGIDRYTYVELIGSTWTPYLKYGILAKIFSSDSELKDEMKANYCSARFLEGINLAAALMDTFTG